MTYMSRYSLTIIMLVTCISFHADAGNKRDYKARKAFRLLHQCPSTGHFKGHCPNYVIDHIKPLACGGKDEPSNMQWQTKSEAKAKDKWERKYC